MDAMATRRTKFVTCPTCAISGDVIFIKHTPLKSDSGVSPYFTARSSDAFTVTTIAKRPNWQGTIQCNGCKTMVRNDAEGHPQ
jgi:hypothetical protein